MTPTDHPTTPEGHSSLVLTVKVGETLAIDGPATITLLEKSGQLAKLRIAAARSVSVQVVGGKGPKPRDPR